MKKMEKNGKKWKKMEKTEKFGKVFFYKKNLLWGLTNSQKSIKKKLVNLIACEMSAILIFL